jgi:endonuclease III
VTNRLGWVRSKTVEEAEQKLLDLVPSRYHQTVNRVFVKLGRYICIRSPRCWACPVREPCAFKKKNLVLPKNAEEILADIDRRETVLETLREKAT